MRQKDHVAQSNTGLSKRLGGRNSSVLMYLTIVSLCGLGDQVTTSLLQFLLLNLGIIKCSCLHTRLE